ncbi:MAG TPA: AbrB/MazE/SpoVT family DNA-binding domain-containing protein, partial [Candidatus Acidoferrum sp.]|nr:AbrB/MazE/SpoVT family DNA-binding domain-containing protein [Candidatus Acidoferrum sp.]
IIKLGVRILSKKGPATVRLIDELGRIVLPVEIRKALDWGDKTPVEIWVNAPDNEIIIKRHAFSCAYCGATDNLKEYHKKHICPDCQKAIAEL